MVGAAVGVFLQRWLDAPDRREMAKSQRQLADAQNRIAELEAERNHRELFERFTPRTTLIMPDDSPVQLLRIEADEPIQVESMDYLTEKGANCGSQPVHSALAASIDVPINETYLNEVRRIGPWVDTFDRSAALVFRLHIRKDGQYKEIRHSAVAKPYIKPGPRSVYAI